NIPYKGGTTSAPSGSGAQSIFQSYAPIQRQDLELKVKITPHVNSSNQVRLVIEIDTRDVKDKDFGDNTGPSWAQRHLTTTIVVKDQQPVVIGGLMSDKTTHSVKKVPLLGDIPLVGYFFKSTTHITQKTNLLIFLTPYVIDDQSQLQAIFDR